MKVRVTIKQTDTAVFDIGDLPAGLIEDLLRKNDGTFDGNWSIGDVRGADESSAVESVEVAEAK